MLLVRRLRHVLARSPLAAILAQLLVTSASTLASGGGDFPRWHR